METMPYAFAPTARTVRIASTTVARMNQPNHNRSAISENENRLICRNETTTVVAVNANIAGTRARTPNSCSCLENSRLPSPYESSGPAYICASTGVTFHGQSADMKAGAKNNATDSTVTRMPWASKKFLAQPSSAGPGNEVACVIDG